VNVAVIYLRRTRPELKRTFRVPLFPQFPVIALVISGVFLAAMVTLNVTLALIYLAILALAYFWFHFFVKNNSDAA